MNRREIGSRYEELAAEYLTKKGYQILEKNFRCRIGEIDLIAKDQNTYVFVEVKYRSRNTYGTPSEAVNWRKQDKIRRTAMFYLVRCRLPEDTACRFDVITVGPEENIHHYFNAFGGI